MSKEELKEDGCTIISDNHTATSHNVQTTDEDVDIKKAIYFRVV